MDFQVYDGCHLARLDCRVDRCRYSYCSMSRVRSRIHDVERIEVIDRRFQDLKESGAM